MQTFIRFLFKLFILVVVIGLTAIMVLKTSYSQFIIPVFWYMLGGIACLTAFMHFSLLQISEKSAQKFSSRFMMVSGIKMIIYLIFITIYVFTFTDQAKVFLISFFILYITFTAFEVVQIMLYLKRKN